MSWPQSILQAIQLKPAYLFGIALTCAILLTLPMAWTDWLALTPIISPARGWLAGIGIVALCFGVVGLVPTVQNWRQERKARALVLRALDSLSPGERHLLGYCLSRNQRTILLPLTTQEANVAAGLAHKRILVMAGGSQNIRAWPYMIPHYVWEELRLRQYEILSPDDYRDLETQFCRLDVVTSGCRGATHVL